MNMFLMLKRGDLALVARSMSFGQLLRVTARNLLYFNHYFVLEARLNGEVAPAGKTLRPGELVRLTDKDLSSLKEQVQHCTGDDKRELLLRILFYENGFRNCYAYKIAGEIAYLQWIVYPRENDLIHARYRRRFPPLRPKQVMLENAFTFARYRGLGVMPFVTTELLRKARAEGYSSAVCYVLKENVNALNTNLQVGYKIKRLVREYKFLGRVWRAF